jgi:hypothetical protein
MVRKTRDYEAQGIDNIRRGMIQKPLRRNQSVVKVDPYPRCSQTLCKF